MAHAYDTDLDVFELYHKAIEQDQKTSILGGPALPALGHAFSGAAGSAISTAITYPLSLVITRLQVQKQLRKSDGVPEDDEYKSLVDAAEKIYDQEGGLSAFYRGLPQDAAKTILDSFLFFLAYNFIRNSRLQSHGTKRLPMAEELGVGMVAGAFSRFFTTPVGNIVTRKQTEAMIAARSARKGGRGVRFNIKGASVSEIVQSIRDEKGIAGFWSGYSATLVLTFNPALTFLLHETFIRMLVKREKRDNPGSRTTFIVAAISKAIASTITYPFSLAKSRSQISKKSPSQPTSTSREDEEKAANQSKGSIPKQTKRVANEARQRTVFEVVLQIAREEGFFALYQGLGGEVLKGFFAHGLTMLLKERIHKVVVRTYYFLLKLAKKYPSPEELAKTTASNISDAASDLGEKAREVGEQARDLAGQAGEQAKDFAGQASDQAKEIAGQASDQVKELTGQAGDKAKEISEPVGETVEKTVGTVSELYRNAKESSMDIVDEYVPADDDD